VDLKNVLLVSSNQTFEMNLMNVLHVSLTEILMKVGVKRIYEKLIEKANLIELISRQVVELIHQNKPLW
jgi:hypothetical protein